MGVKALRKIQLGQESTGSFGTAVAATALWRGTGTIADNRVVEFPEEDIGYLSGTDRSYTPQVEAGLTFEDTPATFEQIHYVLQAGLEKVSATSGDTDYVWQYDFPTTSANNIQAFTIEGGDDENAVEMEYSFVQSFTLSGSGGEAWMLSADWIGRQVTSTGVTFSTGVSVPSVEEILFSKTKLYIDSSTGSFGGTQVSNTLLSATVNVNTGIKPKYTAEGQKYFSFHFNDMPEITLDVTFEHDSNAVTEFENWQDETARLIRLESTGSDLASSGATYSDKTMIIDMAGKWESFDAIGDEDGNDILTGTFRARYNATASDFGKIIIVEDNNTLT